ncbi:MAG: hypothetical protein ACJAU8_000578 [Candidatus Paceibacteria bacterium]|jgi:hypothetical protein
MQKEHTINLTINNGELLLRNLSVSTPEIVSLIDDLNIFLKDSSEELNSFSFSYNHNLGEVGLMKLLEVLPESIHVIGLVDCGLDDRDITDLLQWIKINAQLNVICIEDNIFSKEPEGELVDLCQIMSISLFT